jgi:hypothetical protein
MRQGLKNGCRPNGPEGIRTPDLSLFWIGVRKGSDVLLDIEVHVGVQPQNSMACPKAAVTLS